MATPREAARTIINMAAEALDRMKTGMRSSAAIDLDDAEKFYAQRRYEIAAGWALRSLSYSTSFGSRDYKLAKQVFEDVWPKTYRNPMTGW